MYSVHSTIGARNVCSRCFFAVFESVQFIYLVLFGSVQTNGAAVAPKRIFFLLKSFLFFHYLLTDILHFRQLFFNVFFGFFWTHQFDRLLCCICFAQLRSIESSDHINFANTHVLALVRERDRDRESECLSSTSSGQCSNAGIMRFVNNALSQFSAWCEYGVTAN